MEISLGELYLNEHQKIQVQKILVYLDNLNQEYNFPNKFLSFAPEQLDDCSIVKLQKLLDLKSILFDLEEIHIKTLKTNEYKTIEKILASVPTKLDLIRKNITCLEDSLRQEFSLISENNPVFASLFKYSDFKIIFQSLVQDQVISYALSEEYLNQGFFELIRQKFLSHQIDQYASSLNEEINLASLDKKSHVYLLLACEFFFQYCQEVLGPVKFAGTLSQLELIRPSHYLAKKFDLTISESAVLGISLNPFNQLNEDFFNQISYFDLMFEKSSPLEYYQLEVCWPLKLNQKTYILKVPVYFCYLRLQLIDGQRSGREK